MLPSILINMRIPQFLTLSTLLPLDDDQKLTHNLPRHQNYRTARGRGGARVGNRPQPQQNKKQKTAGRGGEGNPGGRGGGQSNQGERGGEGNQANKPKKQEG